MKTLIFSDSAWIFRWTPSFFQMLPGFSDENPHFFRCYPVFPMKTLIFSDFAWIFRWKPSFFQMLPGFSDENPHFFRCYPVFPMKTIIFSDVTCFFRWKPPNLRGFVMKFPGVVAGSQLPFVSPQDAKLTKALIHTRFVKSEAMTELRRYTRHGKLTMVYSWNLQWFNGIL